MPERIAVVGVHDADTPLTPAAAWAVGTADLVVGGQRHLDAHAPRKARSLVISGELQPVLDAIAAEAGHVCVLASGDPGFFGIARVLSARFGRRSLDVHPAPSSVSLAFARAGLSWDDATVVSAHGRPLADAVARVAACDKAAVLVSPENPPQALGAALVDAGATHDIVVVASRLGSYDEGVVETDLCGLATGEWDPRAVVVLAHENGGPASKTLAWGLDDGRFASRGGMITKAEVRAVALGKLDLPPTGTMWDVGAGSGSVAVECARLAPRLRIHAIERREDDAARIGENAALHGVHVMVEVGEAPAALAALPEPDRVFVGGGGIEVIEHALSRLRTGGRIVATFAALDRAAAAADLLGSLVQVAVSRGDRLPDGSFRLAAINPVFVAWGPTA